MMGHLQVGLSGAWCVVSVCVQRCVMLLQEQVDDQSGGLLVCPMPCCRRVAPGRDCEKSITLCLSQQIRGRVPSTNQHRCGFVCELSLASLLILNRCLSSATACCCCSLETSVLSGPRIIHEQDPLPLGWCLKPRSK